MRTVGGGGGGGVVSADGRTVVTPGSPALSPRLVASRRGNRGRSCGRGAGRSSVPQSAVTAGVSFPRREEIKGRGVV